MLTVQVNEKQMKETQRLLANTPRALPKILTRSINKVATKAKTLIIRRVTAELNVKKKHLRNRQKPAVGLKKANYTTLEAIITISGKRIPLSRFGARKTKKGVTYKLTKGRPRKRLRHSFLQVMTSGHRGVYRRKGKSRLPIIERFGPSVPVAMGNIRNLAQGVLDEQISSDLKGEINRQVGLVLERRRGAVV